MFISSSQHSDPAHEFCDIELEAKLRYDGEGPVESSTPRIHIVVQARGEKYHLSARGKVQQLPKMDCFAFWVTVVGVCTCTEVTGCWRVFFNRLAFGVVAITRTRFELKFHTLIYFVVGYPCSVGSHLALKKESGKQSKSIQNSSNSLIVMNRKGNAQAWCPKQSIILSIHSYFIVFV